MDQRQIEGKKILVTGGAGFIGSNLCEHFLNTGNVVTCLDNFSTGRRINLESFLHHTSFHLIEGDIRDYAVCEAAVKGQDLIFHQAALGSVPRSINDPVLTNACNISGFLNMLTAAKENNIGRFIYAASSSTYGDSRELPKVEDQIGKPLSPYAVTKYVNELYAAVFSDLYGIETIGLRYFNVFGRRQDPNGAYAAVIPKFVNMMLNREAPTINGDGGQTRDFTYIDNVIHANVQAALVTDPKAVNTVYNVAYGANISLIQLVDHLKTLLTEYSVEINNIEVKHGPDRVGDIRDSLASIDKARSLLGYQPKYDVLRGLQEAIQYYIEAYETGKQLS